MSSAIGREGFRAGLARACFIVCASGCAANAGAGDERGSGEGSEAPLEVDARSLCCGSRETAATGISAIENLMFSSDARLFASGDDAVFELVRDASALSLRVLTPPASCHFSGLGQIADTLYAACYDYSDSYVYAAALTSAPSFRVIYKLAGVVLANGAATDERGNLYLAASLQGAILRLQFDPGDPFTVAREEAFIPDTGGIFPNGLKYFGSALYFTDFGSVNRVRVLADGSPSAVVNLVNRVTFFDDLYVSAGRLLVADYLAGSVAAFTQRGFPLGATPAGMFDGPSAVLPAAGRLGFGEDDLLVAEKGPGQVAVYHPAN